MRKQHLKLKLDSALFQSEIIYKLLSQLHKVFILHLSPLMAYPINLTPSPGVRVPVVLVGNKTDLHVERVVTTEAGRRVADKWKAVFLETSAKQHEVRESAVWFCCIITSPWNMFSLILNKVIHILLDKLDNPLLSRNVPNPLLSRNVPGVYISSSWYEKCVVLLPCSLWATSSHGSSLRLRRLTGTWVQMGSALCPEVDGTSDYLPGLHRELLHNCLLISDTSADFVELSASLGLFTSWVPLWALFF